MDLETYRMLQDPNFSLIVIWGMVCITAVSITTVAYFFSMLNNLFFHYSKKKDKEFSKIDQLVEERHERIDREFNGKPKGSSPITNK